MIERDGKLKKHGFFTNIYLKAQNEADAEYKSMDVLRANEKLRLLVQNDKVDPPAIHVEEITEISNYDDIEPKEQGLIWYDENNEKRV